MTDFAHLNLFDYARAVVMQRVQNQVIITGEDVVTDNDPKIEPLSDNQYWELVAEVDRIVKTAQVVIIFPEEP